MNEKGSADHPFPVDPEEQNPEMQLYFPNETIVACKLDYLILKSQDMEERMERLEGKLDRVLTLQPASKKRKATSSTPATTDPMSEYEELLESIDERLEYLKQLFCAFIRGKTTSDTNTPSTSSHDNTTPQYRTPLKNCMFCKARSRVNVSTAMRFSEPPASLDARLKLAHLIRRFLPMHPEEGILPLSVFKISDADSLWLDDRLRGFDNYAIDSDASKQYLLKYVTRRARL
ncbi:hypothetical protein GCK32_005932 [Trichostrongylus colubriformis]|uniref:Uncharacterized protein n=1 Tax=Trichostrongylus colubriformis TaxID=6319 RepID=A0AAN8IQN8_TRICO